MNILVSQDTQSPASALYRDTVPAVLLLCRHTPTNCKTSPQLDFQLSLFLTQCCLKFIICVSLGIVPIMKGQIGKGS